LTEILKCSITILGLFQLPDIFVNKDNYSNRESDLNAALGSIKQMVNEGRLKMLYEDQSRQPITFDYFEGPRRLPNNRERNNFWKSMLDYGVWAPLFYISSDILKVEIDSCEDTYAKKFFNKVSLSEKAPIRLFIRIFPIGGYSIHSIFDFTISNNSEGFTIEDLQIIVEDLFDSIKFKIKTKSGVITSNITISEIFKKMGSKIRDNFLLNPNQMHLGMSKHTIINIDKYNGDWSKEDIKELTEGGMIKLGIIPEDLTKGDITSIIATDVYHSGEMCTLLVPTTKNKKRQYLKEIIDVAEFVHLRKLIVEEYTKQISDKNIELAGKIDDLSFLNAVRNKIARRNVTWINERFIANLQRLIELDKRIKSPKLRENIVLRMLESIKYEDTLKELRKELERAQTYTEKYNKELSKRLKIIIQTIEEAIRFIT
jgi:hypothetical protein